MKPSSKVAIAVALIIAIVGVLFLYIQISKKIYVFVPLSVDVYLGDKFSKQFEKNIPVVKDSKYLKFLNSLTEEFTRDSKFDSYTVQVMDSEEVNAFALPGGKIYFFKGLLEQAQSPEEVATVLAHEIAHVEKRHSVQQLCRSITHILLFRLAIGGEFSEAEFAETVAELSSIFLLLSYSREFEREADEIAIETCLKFNIDLAGFIDFFERLEHESGSIEIPSFLSTHPSYHNRIENIKDIMNKQEEPFKEFLHWPTEEK